VGSDDLHDSFQLTPSHDAEDQSHPPAQPSRRNTRDTELALLELLDEVLRVLRVELTPDIRDQILHSEFLTPADLEREYRVTGGHWHHTEFAVDQMLMMRPTYEAAQYSTPIPGLYLCGAGCHPGGDLTGAAGYNAAQEVLR